MASDHFSSEQKQLILNAQRLIDEAAADYGTELQQHIKQLHATVGGNDLDGAIKTCYLIQSQAATFGWPLATEVAGWFKKLLLRQRDSGPNLEVNHLFLNSFDQILSDEMTGESDAALKLLQHIETTLRAGENN